MAREVSSAARKLPGRVILAAARPRRTRENTSALEPCGSEDSGSQIGGRGGGGGEEDEDEGEEGKGCTMGRRITRRRRTKARIG